MRASLNAIAGLLLGAFILVGCKPRNAAPTPLSAEQISGEMRKAFAQAPAETKKLVETMLDALQSTNYPAAYQSSQLITSASSISKEQLLVTSRAMLTINALLQQASSQGDSSAAAFLGYQKHNR